MMCFSIAAFSQSWDQYRFPKVTLHVEGKPDVATAADGVMAPRMTGDQLRAKDNVYLAAQTGALVYVTQAVTVPSVKQQK